MLFATKTGMGTVLPMICLCFKGRTKMDEAVARFNLRVHSTKRTRLCITLRLLLLFFTTPCLNSDHPHHNSPYLQLHKLTSELALVFVIFDLTPFPSLAIYFQVCHFLFHSTRLFISTVTTSLDLALWGGIGFHLRPSHPPSISIPR